MNSVKALGKLSPFIFNALCKELAHGTDKITDVIIHAEYDLENPENSKAQVDVGYSVAINTRWKKGISYGVSKYTFHADNNSDLNFWVSQFQKLPRLVDRVR